MEKFTVDYFIKKFEAIPEELWCVGEQYNRNTKQRCALGLCNFEHDGTRKLGAFDVNSESDRLSYILPPVEVIKNISGNSGYESGGIADREFGNNVAAINNGESKRYQQPTPKQRILAALYDIKKLSEPVTELPSPEMDFVKAIEIKEKNKNLILVN